jgi:hypothetical protein
MVRSSSVQQVRVQRLHESVQLLQQLSVPPQPSWPVLEYQQVPQLPSVVMVLLPSQPQEQLHSTVVQMVLQVRSPVILRWQMPFLWHINVCGCNNFFEYIKKLVQYEPFILDILFFPFAYTRFFSIIGSMAKKKVQHTSFMTVELQNMLAGGILITL